MTDSVIYSSKEVPRATAESWLVFFLTFVAGITQSAGITLSPPAYALASNKKKEKICNRRTNFIRAASALASKND